MENSRPHITWKRRTRREIQKARRTVILGVGNKTRGDDAAGIVCSGKLKKSLRGKARSRLKISLGYESPESLTGEIRKFDPDLVLILDAAVGPHRPGAVFLVEKDRIPDEGFSTHKLSLALFVRYLEESIGCKVMVLGIQPETIGFNVRTNELSDPVKKSVNTLAEFLSKTLAKKYRI
ncbi:MAG: hydrogenase 3 maturation endopeptidase HyCI [Candidatus Aminicenantes bacterium]|nr:hydrogenase 3 maturation endopeptidase HyCI [Candidatus Aminicenantes bacterium]